MKIFGIAGHSGMGKTTLWPAWPGILAIASDTPSAVPAATDAASDVVPLDLANIALVADFVLQHALTR